MKPTLDALGLKYGTGKASTIHNYCRYYERHLAHLRDERFTLLELGVAGGDSLRMWSDYFPGAVIIGLDCGERPPTLEEHFFYYQGHQDDCRLLWKMADEHGPFDVIVDDASHNGPATITSFEFLWQHLSDRGIYVVEDLQTAYHTEYGQPAFVSRIKELIDELNLQGRYGNADVRTLPGCSEFIDNLTGWERTLESITLYPFLAFLFKDVDKYLL